MTGTIREIPDGTRGFDCNQPLSADQCRAAMAKGYRFVARYLPRVLPPHTWDLSAVEAQRILTSGLAVFGVQHVESETSWMPSAVKGQECGSVAAATALRCGLLPGSSLACDLEGVDVTAPADHVMEYLRQWDAAVTKAGFLSTLYVGWHCGLTPVQLYQAPMTRYWGALNLNADEFPSTRGLCLKQHEEKSGDRPDGFDFAIDTDTAMTDALGGRIVVVASDEWDVAG